MLATSTITRSLTGFHELRLQGPFPHPHWIAFLFAGLAQSGVSVVSGRAVQDDKQEWDARINLDFKNSKVTPESLDYIALAARKPVSADMTIPRLSRFQITPRYDGSLEVTLEGPDQIGFLGRLLGRLSLLMLFPSELDINTVSGTIRDRIVLRGIMGTLPAQTMKESLETLLKGLVSSS